MDFDLFCCCSYDPYLTVFQKAICYLSFPSASFSRRHLVTCICVRSVNYLNANALYHNGKVWALIWDGRLIDEAGFRW